MKKRVFFRKIAALCGFIFLFSGAILILVPEIIRSFPISINAKFTIWCLSLIAILIGIAIIDLIFNISNIVVGDANPRR